MTRISDAPAPYGVPRKPGISLDFVLDLNSVIDLPADTLAKAVRNVAARAADTGGTRLLLDVLGLLPAPTEESL